MTHVTVGPNYMTIEGHAGDTIVCAMITSQIVGLIKNLDERLKEEFDFVLIPGFFDIRTDTLSDEGKSLVNACAYCMSGIAGSYPHNVQYLHSIYPKEKAVSQNPHTMEDNWWKSDPNSKKLYFRS